MLEMKIMCSSPRGLIVGKVASPLVIWLMLLSSYQCFGFRGATAATAITVTVNGHTRIAQVGDNFVCAALDWYYPHQCTSDGTCIGDSASILNLDLKNTRLQNAVKGLSPLLIRVGGRLQDQVVYKIGNPSHPCLPFTTDPSARFGVKGGCLNMTRWEALNNFFKQTGSKLAFGLSASYGRENNLNSGNWDPSNTQNLISFTASQGYDIFAWELGNELLGQIPPSRYASDVKTFRGIIDKVYGSSSNKPLLVAPDAVFNEDLYRQFLQSSRPNDIDVCTAHIYNIGPATDPIGVLEDRILNPTVLNNERTAFNNMNNLLKAHGSWTKPGVGEAGGIFHGGAHLVSDAFLNSFWYTDQLGMAATFGNHFYCRQTLVGFYYGLLDTTTLRPNPDFYSAKLWTDLMGNNVLPAIVTGSPYLRAYSHCSKGDTASATVILINLSKTTDFSVKLILSGSNGCQGTSGCQRLEYHLTAPQGNLHSRTIMLNGNILDLLPDDQLPDMNPRVVDSSTPISVVRTSIVYVKLVNVSLPACSQA